MWKTWIFCIVLGALIVAAAAYQVSRSRSFQLFGEIVAWVETDQKVIALTFDDGPTAAHTAATLQMLRDAEATATFFLVGQSIDAQQSETRAIINAGHEIGNHSWSHPRLMLMSRSRIKSEIERTDTAIRDAGYTGPIPFRPPFGKKLVMLPLYLASENRPTIMWDMEPDGHADLANDPDAYAAHVIETARPGSILLMHTMFSTNQTARDALLAILTGLQNNGYEFVTVSALLDLATAP